MEEELSIIVMTESEFIELWRRIWEESTSVCYPNL